MNQVILASCLLGLAHAAIMVHSFTLVADRFAPSERGRYLGLLAAVSIFPMAVGPSLGGIIADRLSWRWAYSVSVPLEALAMVAVWLTVSDWRTRSARPSIDWAGVGTLLGWVTPLLLALTLVGQGNAPALGVRALLIAAAGTLGAFLLVERHAANPLLNLNLFRYRRISLASASIFLTGISVWALGVYLPLFLQGVLGASAARSGVVFGQYVLATIAGNVIGGRLLSRTAWQPRCAFGASGVAAIGLVLLSQMDGSTTGLEILRNVIICGIGLGALTPTYDVLVQNATPRESLGVASGLTQFLHAIGGAIGLGFFSTMLMRLYRMQIDQLIPQDAPPQLKHAFDNPLQFVFTRPNLDSAVSHVQNGASLLQRLLEGSHAGLLLGMHCVFAISAVAMGISCVLSIFLSRAKS
jgi:MFS family permease